MRDWSAAQALKSFGSVALLCVLSLSGSLWLLRSLFFDVSPPTIKTVRPSYREMGVSVSAPIRVTFDKEIQSGSVSNSTLLVRDDSGRVVPAAVGYQPDTHSAILQP